MRNSKKRGEARGREGEEEQRRGSAGWETVGGEKKKESEREREREQGVYKRWKEREITGKERHRVNLSLPPSLPPSQQPAIFRDLRSESWKWCIAAGSVWLKDANRRTTTLNQHYLNVPSIFNSPPELRLQPNRVTKGAKTAQGGVQRAKVDFLVENSLFSFFENMI